MSIISRLWNSLAGQDQYKRRIAEEMTFHMDERERENLAAGMTPQGYPLPPPAGISAQRIAPVPDLWHDTPHPCRPYPTDPQCGNARPAECRQ